MWKRAARAAVRASLRNARLRSVVEAELKRLRPSPTREAPPPPPHEEIANGSEFVDRHGVHHPLDPGLRDRLKGGWRTMVDPVVASEPPTDEILRGRARKAAKVVAEASTLVETITGKPLAGRILEIGCYDGAAAFHLAGRSGTQVVASDLARYYVVQRPGVTVDDADIPRQQALLADIRERARIVAEIEPGVIEFVEDDISASTQPSESLDAIVSFEVLEHVQRPAEAFAEMARLLRPGGIVYHDYNPFFSANGGHSLCTLAIPWGHARLDADDFRRYVEEFRPTEIEQALRFYNENLNRMALADLRHALQAARLESLAVIPWFDRVQASMLDPRVLPEVQRTYPAATIDDLLATFVCVIARKPG